MWCSFLAAFNNDPAFSVGMIDFAGSGVVHMTGGASRFFDADGTNLLVAQICGILGRR